MTDKHVHLNPRVVMHRLETLNTEIVQPKLTESIENVSCQSSASSSTHSENRVLMAEKHPNTERLAVQIAQNTANESDATVDENQSEVTLINLDFAGVVEIRDDSSSTNRLPETRQNRNVIMLLLNISTSNRSSANVSLSNLTAPSQIEARIPEPTIIEIDSKEHLTATVPIDSSHMSDSIDQLVNEHLIY